MADTKTNVNITFTGNINDLVKSSEKVKDNLKSAASTSFEPAAVRMAKVGVANAAKAKGNASEDSNTARGVGGLTGAAGRDFAAQSKGLGGLVHVYATFAANIFAVSAAFTALSKAADTANLVKGLDQIGAASGRGLGALSKSLVAATDGAINLRDAMTATALASAGGMTNKQIMQMGTVARSAAQALGVAMPDAINRLSKGITKMQPELLDELGLMTRVDTATREYAKSVGKSVEALTTFERRQAFANAVLKEGEEKFGAISMEANPYQKILASTENLISSGLTLINKVLGPIMNMLSSSPTALTAALAGVVGILLKQALPAITQWRQGMIKASEDARNALIKANELRKDKIMEGASQVGKAVVLAEEKLITGYANLFDNRMSKSTKNILAGVTDASKLTDEQLNKLAKQADILEKRGMANGGPTDPTVSKATAARRSNDILEASNIKSLLASRDEYNAKLNKALEIEKDIDRSLLGRLKTYISIDAANDRIANKAARQATQTSILAKTAENLPTSGVKESFITLFGDIKNAMKGKGLEDGQAKLGKLDATITAIKGSASILTQGLTTLASSLGNIGMIVGVGIGAFQLLDSWLSNNAKEAEASAKAFGMLSDASANLERTLQNIAAKDPLKQISTESINARANAVFELASAFEDAGVKMKASAEKAGNWDIIMDTIAYNFGGGKLRSSAKEFAISMSEALKGAVPSKEKTTAENTLKDILGVDPNDFEKVYEKLKASPEVLLSTVPKLSTVLKQLGTDLSNIASYGKVADESFTKVGKSLDAILFSALPSDTMGKFGIEMTEAAKAAADAFNQPTLALGEMVKAFSDVSRLRLVNPDTAAQLLAQSEAAKQAAAAIVVLNDQYKESKKRSAEISSNSRRGGASSQVTAEADIQKNITQSIAVYEARIKTFTDSAVKANNDIFIKGAEIVRNSILQAFDKASLAMSKAILSLLSSNTLGSIQGESANKQAELDLQLRQIDSQEQLIISQELLRESIERQTINEEKSALEAKKGTLSPEEYSKQLGKLLIREAVLAIPKERYMGKSGLSQANEDLRSGSEVAQAAAKSKLDFAQKATGYQAAKATVEAQKFTVELEKQAKLISRDFDIIKDSLALELSRTEVVKTRNDSETRLLPYLTAAQLAAKNSIEEALATTRAKQSQLAVEEQIAKARKAIEVSAVGSTDRANAEKTLAELQVKRSKELEKADNDKKIRAVNYSNTVVDNTKKEFDYRMEVSKILFDTQINKEQTILSIREEGINRLRNLANISAEYIAIQDAQISLDREDLRLKEAQKRIVDEIAKAEEERSRIISNLPTGEKDTVTGAETAKQDAQISAGQAALANEVALSNAKKATILAQRDMNVLVANQEESMKRLVSVTESLSSVFGKVGKSIGESAIAFASFAQMREKHTKELEQLEAQKNKTDNPEEYFKIEKEIGDLKAKQQVKESLGIANIASANKKMFSEKTAAFKILSAVEKAALIQSMALQAQAVAKDLAALPSKVAGGVGKLVEQSGWVGLVGAGAFMALIASIVGKSFSGGTVGMPSGGFDAESQQKVQGTGQRYDASGNIVNRGGGALGDPTAKASSVESSISLIEEHSFKTMEYSNKMLDSLRGIKRNTEGLTDALMRAGINVAGRNPDGSTQFGVSNEYMKPLIGSLGETLTRIFGKDSGIGKLLGNVTAKIFGGKTTVSLEDTGIQVSGLLSKIVESADGLALSYSNIKKVVDGGWFKSDKTVLSTEFKKLDDSVTRYISGMFKDIRGAVTEASNILGKDTSLTSSIVDNFNVDFKTSFKDLKPEEAAEALMSEISVMFNQLAEKVAPDLLTFRKAGEEMGTALVRLARDMQVVGLSLEQAGIAINYVGDTLSRVNITERLIELVGGLDEFVSKTTYFTDNFLTESERLAPIQKKLSTELNKLGLSSVDTREEFADVVRALDLTTEGGQAIYTSMMNIAEAFATVYPETRKVLTAEQLRKSQLDQQIEIYRLENRSAEALLATRQYELSQMDDRLKVGQLYIYALQDENTLKSKLKTAYDKEKSALESTVNAMKSSIKTIQAYKDSLLIGNQSILTPSQKYEEAKQQALKVAAIATGIANSDAEKQAKTDAINQLPTVSTAFLEASRMIFASSDQYSRDFSYIQDLLSSTSSALSAQETDAQKQLDALNTNTTILEIIQDNTGNTTEILSQLLAATNSTAIARNAANDAGYTAQGTLVGNGPDAQAMFFELLTTTLGSIVPSIDLARTQPVKIDDSALIAEIASLKAEVVGLRADQATHTAAIVVGNATVADTSANKIIEAANENVDDTLWQFRSQFIKD